MAPHKVKNLFFLEQILLSKSRVILRVNCEIFNVQVPILE